MKLPRFQNYVSLKIRKGYGTLQCQNRTFEEKLAKVKMQSYLQIWRTKKSFKEYVWIKQYS